MNESMKKYLRKVFEDFLCGLENREVQGNFRGISGEWFGFDRVLTSLKVRATVRVRVRVRVRVGIRVYCTMKLVSKTHNSQRHEINTFKEKPSVASPMEVYINELQNQIDFNRQFYTQFLQWLLLLRRVSNWCWLNSALDQSNIESGSSSQSQSDFKVSVWNSVSLNWVILRWKIKLLLKYM